VTDYDRIIREGNYVNAEGQVLGRHCGYPNYTIGQRKGLGIALGHPAFVTAIRPDTNEVVLGSNDDLYQAELTATEVRLRDTEWLAESPVVQARIRYKSQPVDATIESECTTATLRFAQPVWGITPGQSLVLYKDNLVIGGGIIACPQP
jgi:tRNA-specific 2-thiouridylase